MTDETSPALDDESPPTWNSPRGLAGTVHGILDQAMHLDGQAGCNAFSGRQLALIQDSRGLLVGIRNGTIVKGQQRLADNLLEAMSLFDGPPGSPDPARNAILERLGFALYTASLGGLTVEAFELTNNRRVTPTTR